MSNGRPPGSRNIRNTADVEPSRCICGSSRRSAYRNKREVDYSGTGQDVITIIYRTCDCSDCGQARVDREKVYAPVENKR